MYYDELLETVDNDVSYLGNKTSPGKVYDKNYDKYKILFNKIWTDGKFYKTLTIEKYGSGQQGTRIRNAVSGKIYPHLVGSRNEDLYFKVSDACSRFGRRDPLTLYYDTPEQYESHNLTTVRQSVKDMWYNKCLEARREFD